MNTQKGCAGERAAAVVRGAHGGATPVRLRWPSWPVRLACVRLTWSQRCASAFAKRSRPPRTCSGRGGGRPLHRRRPARSAGVPRPHGRRQPRALARPLPRRTALRRRRPPWGGCRRRARTVVRPARGARSVRVAPAILGGGAPALASRSILGGGAPGSARPVLGAGLAPPAFGGSTLARPPLGFFALARPVVGVPAAFGGLAPRGGAALVRPNFSGFAQPAGAASVRPARGVDPAASPAPTVVVVPACLVRFYEKVPSAAPVGCPSAVHAAFSSCPLMQLDTRSTTWVLPEQLLRRINVVHAPDCDQPAAATAGAPPMVFVNVFLDRLMRDGAAIPAPDDADDPDQHGEEGAGA